MKLLIVKLKGGLGNQLFQYATAKSLAEKSNARIIFDSSYFFDDAYGRKSTLNKYNINIIEFNRGFFKSLITPGNRI